MHNSRLARLAIVTIAFGLVAASPPPALPVWNCGPPLAGWKTFRGDKTNAVNTLVLSPANEGMTRPAGVTWNGAVVTPDQVREYTSLTAQMAPIPTLLLVVTYGPIARSYPNMGTRSTRRWSARGPASASRSALSAGRCFLTCAFPFRTLA